MIPGMRRGVKKENQLGGAYIKSSLCSGLLRLGSKPPRDSQGPRSSQGLLWARRVSQKLLGVPRVAILVFFWLFLGLSFSPSACVVLESATKVLELPRESLGG